MPEVEKYPDDILKLLSAEGFIAAVWAASKQYEYGYLAYEAVEREYEKYFNRRKYADYQSFVHVRSRVVKKKK